MTLRGLWSQCSRTLNVHRSFCVAKSLHNMEASVLRGFKLKKPATSRLLPETNPISEKTSISSTNEKPSSENKLDVSPNKLIPDISEFKKGIPRSIMETLPEIKTISLATKTSPPEVQTHASERRTSLPEIRTYLTKDAPTNDLENETTRNKVEIKKEVERPFRVSVEGNIGCGKSTFIQFFQRVSGVEGLLEPIDEWRNVNGHNLLDLLYSDLQRWNYTFQNYLQLSRTRIQTQDAQHTVQLFERSVQNNRYCFGEMAFKDKLLSPLEFFVFDQWYQWIEANTDVGLDLIVYLRSSPEVVHRRLVERCRAEESSVPLEYLVKVHEAHEEWLLHHRPKAPPAPVLVLDADCDMRAMEDQYMHHQEKILGLRNAQKLKC